MAQDVVLLLFVAELVGIKADVLEYIFELGAVGLFDGMQRLVDTFAVTSLKAALVQSIERSALSEDECLLLQWVASSGGHPSELSIRKLPTTCSHLINLCKRFQQGMKC